MGKTILAAIGIMFILAGCMSDEEIKAADSQRELRRAEKGEMNNPVEYDKAKRNEF